MFNDTAQRQILPTKIQSVHEDILYSDMHASYLNEMSLPNTLTQWVLSAEL